MNIKQLEVFTAIMSLGSTKAAAESLGQSQSAISRMLAQLEADLGLELFIRSKGRLLAKPEAAELLISAVDIMERVNGMARHAEEIRLGRFRNQLVKVAVPYTLALNYMPRLIERLMAENPGIVFEVLTGSYVSIESKVENREADLGFTRVYENPHFEFDKIDQCEAVCVMPKGHPLSELKVITAKDLAAVPMVLLGRQSSARKDIDFYFHRQGVKPKVKIEVHSVGVACQFVAKGLGVSIVNSILLDSLEDNGLDWRPLVEPPLYSYGLIYKAGRPRSKMVERVAHTMKADLQARSHKA